MQTSTDSPGVHFPPPLFYASAVLAGWLLNRSWPLPIDGVWRLGLGWVFVAVIGWHALLAAADARRAGADRDWVGVLLYGAVAIMAGALVVGACVNAARSARRRVR